MIYIELFKHITCFEGPKTLQVLKKSHIVLIYGNLCKIVGNNGKYV